MSVCSNSHMPQDRKLAQIMVLGSFDAPCLYGCSRHSVFTVCLVKVNVSLHYRHRCVDHSHWLHIDKLKKRLEKVTNQYWDAVGWELWALERVLPALNVSTAQSDCALVRAVWSMNLNYLQWYGFSLFKLSLKIIVEIEYVSVGVGCICIYIYLLPLPLLSEHKLNYPYTILIMIVIVPFLFFLPF